MKIGGDPTWGRDPQVGNRCYSLIINTRAGSARQGDPKKTLKNCPNFVPAKKKFFKICKLL